MKWHQTSQWLEERRDIWLDLLRIYLGIGLFIRGMILFGGESGVMLRQLGGETGDGWLMPAMIGHYVAIAHAAGGVMLAFGLLTLFNPAITLAVLILFFYAAPFLGAAQDSVATLFAAPGAFFGLRP